MDFGVSWLSKEELENCLTCLQPLLLMIEFDLSNFCTIFLIYFLWCYRLIPKEKKKKKKEECFLSVRERIEIEIEKKRKERQDQCCWSRQVIGRTQSQRQLSVFCQQFIRPYLILLNPNHLLSNSIILKLHQNTKRYINYPKSKHAILR